jgi:hypothetical protein
MLKKIKRVLKNVISTLPGGWWIIATYKKLGLLKRRLLVKYRTSSNADWLPNSESVFWIDPQRIKMHTNYVKNGNSKPFKDRVFDPLLDKGKIYAGDWDVTSYKFSDLKIYKALHARINKTEEWKETDYYHDTLSRIESGTEPWGCHTKEELDQRCSYLDDLINSIKEKGYKLNHTIKLESEDVSMHGKDKELSEEVSVNISRTGEYLFQDGRHRLAIAQILNIKKIPVKVLVRHKKWAEFRQFIYSMIEGDGGGSKAGALYQIAIHPDLLDIPASHGCEDRFDAIDKNLIKREGTVLDVGANLGYFCHKLEDIGFQCYAVEHLPDIAIAADKLRESEGKSFRVLTGDLYNLAYKTPLKDKKFDVVILLSVLHHSLKRKEDYNRLVIWLKTLDADEIFFEPHNPDEAQMRTAYKNYNEDEFVQFILDNTTLNNATKIHTCDDGRNIYHIVR